MTLLFKWAAHGQNKSLLIFLSVFLILCSQLAVLQKAGADADCILIYALSLSLSLYRQQDTLRGNTNI